MATQPRRSKPANKKQAVRSVKSKKQQLFELYVALLGYEIIIRETEFADSKQRSALLKKVRKAMKLVLGGGAVAAIAARADEIAKVPLIVVSLGR